MEAEWCLLHCDVIIRSTGSGLLIVSAIDPVASMCAIPNNQLKALVERVRRKLETVVAAI
jgi:hypothetical protein